MAVFEIKAPDGKTYRIEGADQAGALAALQAHLGQASTAAQTEGTSQADIDAGLVPSGDTDTRSTQEATGQEDAFFDQAASLGGPMLDTSAAALRGATGQGPSVAGQMFGEPQNWFGRNITNRAADLGIAGLSAVGGLASGAAGAVGDVADAAGVPGAERLGRDLAALPEAFAGSPTAGVAAVGRVRSAPAPTTQTGTRMADDIARAEQSGVRVMTTDVAPPRTAPGRQLQSAGESIPFTGTGGVRAQQFEQRQNAVRNVVQNHADAEIPLDTVLANVSDDLINARSERLTALWDQKSEALNSMPDDVPVDVSRTVSAIDQEIARLNALRSDEYAPIIRKLEDWKGAIADQPIANIEQLRRQMGESFASPDLASIRGEGERVTGRIYGPLRDDMGEFLRENGGDATYNQWRTANEGLSEMVGELSVTSLRNVLKTGEETPENVGRLLFSQKTSDVRRLYDDLSPEGQANARAAVMIDTVNRAGGMEDISPARFASQIARRGRQIGVVFSDADQAVVNGLMRTLKLTEQADRAGLNPPTGVRAVPFLAFDAASGAFGGPAAATATAGGLGAITRAYESRPVRNLLTLISKTEAGSDAERRLFAQLEEITVSPGAVAPATVTGQAVTSETEE